MENDNALNHIKSFVGIKAGEGMMTVKQLRNKERR